MMKAVESSCLPRLTYPFLSHCHPTLCRLTSRPGRDQRLWRVPS